MHLPAILALANGSAHNGHEVVLGRIGDTLEGAIRAREPCQTCARSVGLTVVELLITKLALTRTSLASKRTRTALPQQRLNIHLVHGIAFIISHILHLLAEKALLKSLLQKTGFKLSSSSFNFKVLDDFALQVQKKYRDRYMVPAQYLEHCKACMCARIRRAREDSVQ